MHTFSDLPSYRIPPPRLIAIGFGAALVTVALFAGMQKMIERDGILPPKVKPLPVIDFLQNIEDKPTNLRPKIKPRPEPKPKPKPVAKLVELEPSAGVNTSIFAANINTPKVKIGVQPNFNLIGGGARPIVRVEPKYPTTAARDGIEGWVKLSFSITASGTVDNIKVLDAEPKRVFNQAAKRALAKWKYKPNIHAGQSQAQDGMMVMLDFKLAK